MVELSFLKCLDSYHYDCVFNHCSNIYKYKGSYRRGINEVFQGHIFYIKFILVLYLQNHF